MKVVYNDKNLHVIRLDKDDELITCLTDHVRKNSLTGGYINAIGSAKELILSYYNLDQKSFEDHLLQENLEIVSLNGNISMLNSDHLIHLHGTLSKKDLSVIGGHIKKLIISATCEVILYPIPTKLQRVKDDNTGLNLLK